MFVKVVILFAVIAFANAGFLEPTLRIAAPVPSISHYVASAPVVSYTPAITKTEYLPGSYSSSYRSDVITPRVKYTETPGLSITVHQPAVTVSKVEHVPIAKVETIAPAFLPITKIEHLAPAPLAVAKVETIASPPLPIARLEHIAPVSHAIAKVETFAPSPLPIARVEHIAQAPLAVAKIESFAPASLSVAKLEHIASAPLSVAKVENIAPVPLSLAKYEHIVPSSFALNHAGLLARAF